MPKNPKHRKKGKKRRDPSELVQEPPKLSDIPVAKEVAGIITKYLDYKSLSALCRTSSGNKALFGSYLTEIKLFHSVFMADTESVVRIVRKRPKFLFLKGTYEMPIYQKNPDGSFSDSGKTEQIYNTTPFELILYTGNVKMLNRILTEIPDKKVEKAVELMKKAKRGGPDLVKINRDPTTLTWEELKYDTGRNDDDGNRIFYNLLSNPDGIICWTQADGTIRYYYANPENQIIQEIKPNIRGDEEDFLFKQLQKSILDMPMESSRRTNDKEHALIEKIFDKKLERNGIHYKLIGGPYWDGIDYHDTYDGCNRLINACRKYMELPDPTVNPTIPLNTVWDKWVNIVGIAQRYSAPNIILSFCGSNEFWNDTIKWGIFINGWSPKLENLYPLVANSGLGIKFGLLDKDHGVDVGGLDHFGIRRESVKNDLAQICHSVEVTAAGFNELLEKLNQRLRSDLGPSYK